MAERAGYDQPGDGYKDKNATVGVAAPTPYLPGSSPPQHGYGQQTYPMVPAFGQNTNTTVVSQPQTGAVIIQQKPPDYLIPSILACLFCFPGLYAIYCAIESRNLASVGDYAGATDLSNCAKKLMITSVVVGIILVIISIVLRLKQD